MLFLCTFLAMIVVVFLGFVLICMCSKRMQDEIKDADQIQREAIRAEVINIGKDEDKFSVKAFLIITACTLLLAAFGAKWCTIIGMLFFTAMVMTAFNEIYAEFVLKTLAKADVQPESPSPEDTDLNEQAA